MTEKKPIVYIFNMLEDVLAFAMTLDQDKRNLEYRQCATWYNERELLSLFAQYKDREEFYFVSPWHIDEAYIQYACDLFEIKRENVHVIVPNKTLEDHLGSVSDDMMRDKDLLERLDRIGNFDITSYCMSDEFHNFLNHFNVSAHGIEITSDEDWDKVKKLGTKSGIRELVETGNYKNLIMPKGRIFYHGQLNLDDVIDYAADKLMSEGVVIKIDKAHGGVGVVLFKREEVMTLGYEEIRTYLKEKLNESYWNNFNIVVEDLVDVDFSKHGGAPNIEMKVNDDGEVEVLYVCGLRVENEKDFTGVEFGKDVFEKKVVEQLVDIGKTLGKIYSDLGYRGNFDVDCHIDKEGRIYIAESNIRRTGGTYAYNFATSLFGEEFFKSHYFMTNSITAKQVEGYKFKEVFDSLIENDIGFTKGKDYGVVLTGPRAFDDGVLNYMIVARTREDAMMMERKLKDTINSLKR